MDVWLGSGRLNHRIRPTSPPGLSRYGISVTSRHFKMSATRSVVGGPYLRPKKGVVVRLVFIDYIIQGSKCVSGVHVSAISRMNVRIRVRMEDSILGSLKPELF